MPNDFKQLAEEAIYKLIDERNIAIENLTKKQMGDAILQMIQSGDFTRYVRVDNGAQSVVYIPFAKEEQDHLYIKYLQKLLDDNNIEYDSYYPCI